MQLLAPIETTRLLLRLPVADDAGPFLEIHQDPEVLARKRVTLTSPPGGIETGLRNVDRMCRHWDRLGFGQWAVVEKETAQVIGCVGFVQPDNWPGIDLGWIIRRSRWGKVMRRKRRGRRSTGSGASVRWTTSEPDRSGQPGSIRVATRSASVRGRASARSVARKC